MKVLNIFAAAAVFSVALLTASCFERTRGLDIYQRGHYQEAIEYWKKPPRQGMPDRHIAQRRIFRRQNRQARYAFGFQILKQAADGNDARALTDLASMYDYGTGVKEDREKAAGLYLRAARMGMPAAMFNIASMLETGEGIGKDEIEAYKYYLLSRDQGFAPFANKALETMASTLTADQIAEAESRADNFIPGY